MPLYIQRDMSCDHEVIMIRHVSSYLHYRLHRLIRFLTMDCSEFNTSSPVEIGDTQLHDKASQSTQAAPAGNGDVPSEPTAERPSEPVSLEDILAQTVTSFTLLSSISSRIEGFTEKDEALRKGIIQLHGIYPGFGSMKANVAGAVDRIPKTPLPSGDEDVCLVVCPYLLRVLC